MRDERPLTQTPSQLREEQFREISDGLPLIVWVHGPSGEQELVNQTFCEFFGVTQEEMKADRWQMLMHPDDSEAYLSEFLECVRNRRFFHAEVRVRRADGEWRWLESWGKPRFASDGEFQGFIGTSADITDRKNTEAAMRKSEERLELALVAGRSGTWDWDLVRDEAVVSASYRDLYGYAPDFQVTYDTWLAAVHSKDRERVRQYGEEFFQSGTNWRLDYRIVHPQKGVRWMEAVGRLHRDSEGRPLRFVGVQSDVTPRRQAEEQLRRSESLLRAQNAELAVRDRNKDLFLSTLGHELRNPLGAIVNSLDLISLVPAGRAGDGDREAAIDIIRRQSDQLLRIVDDLLDLERVKHGKLELRLDNVELVGLANDVIESCRGDAEKLGLEFELTSPEKPLYVRADPARLRQVFQNLLDNALRFTKEGEVAISVRKEAENAEVVIRDTGVGFDPEEAASIFDPYYQSGAAKSTPGGSLGFGLALVKDLVEKHGGTIKAYSSGLGDGAAFTFSMPLVKAVSKESRETSTITKPPCHRILVVDDERDNAEVLRAMLQQLGQATSIAYDGTSALQIAGAQHPEIAFVDLSMPGMSGRELAQRFRETFSPKDLVLVAVTGLPRSVDHAERRDPDFAHYLLKPVKLEAVVKLLNSI